MGAHSTGPEYVRHGGADESERTTSWLADLHASTEEQEADDDDRALASCPPPSNPHDTTRERTHPDA
jgi:hypothetical protein